MARNRRMKSRLRGMSDDARVQLRDQAMKMARERLTPGNAATTGASAEQQKLRHENVRERANRERQVTSHGGAVANPAKGPSQVPFQLHRNSSGNSRTGGLFRTVQGQSRSGKKGAFHVYMSGQRVFVPNKSGDAGMLKMPRHRTPSESGGTGNHGYAKQVNEFAKARVDGGGSTDRKLFATAKTASYGRTDTGKHRGRYFIPRGSDIRNYRRKRTRGYTVT